MINWTQHKRTDGSIDLPSAARAWLTSGEAEPPREVISNVNQYLAHVETLQPIFNVEVAATAIVHASYRADQLYKES